MPDNNPQTASHLDRLRLRLTALRRPAEIIDNISMYQEQTGGFEHASLQVNFHQMPFDEAERSMRMFAEKVMPAFA